MAKEEGVSGTTGSMEDAAYLALADECRREVLIELLDSEERPVSALLADGGSDQSKWRIELHHRHLPLLADEGYVTWDRDTDSVARGPRFDEVRPLVAFHAAEFGVGADDSAIGNGQAKDSGQAHSDCSTVD